MNPDRAEIRSDFFFHRQLLVLAKMAQEVFT
jgi:hypothetical protein